MRCDRHNVETGLRCGKCEKPICPDCTVFGPVGARCRECSSNKGSPLYQVTASKLMVGGIAASFAAFGVSYLLSALHFGIGFFGIWIALIGGSFIGEVLLRMADRKRGQAMEITAGVSAAIGMIGALLVTQSSNTGSISLMALFTSLQHSPFFVINIVILIASAVSRVRFL